MGQKKQNVDIPDFFVSNGIKITGEKNISEGFNDFFVNIGPQLAESFSNSHNSYSDFLGKKHEKTFVFNKVTPKMILEIIKTLKPKTSVGMDNISTKVLKEILPIILSSLVHLFNLSFKTGYIPKQFKTAKVVPIFKSGDKHAFTNYRPISLLTSLSKIIEKLVSKQLNNYLY